MGDASHMDIRLPIGLMFSILGAVIGIYGALTLGDPMYSEHSLGIDVNICWGGVLFLFGLVMLALCWRARCKGKSA
jgi:hypothetical protein